MDSTPNPNPSQPRSQPLSIKPSSSARKLPIKRKTPDSSDPPNPDSSTFLANPKLESSPTTPDIAAEYGGGDEDNYGGGVDRKPPPFKFHRIWTEPDEIRFLQGLRDCSNQGLSFPRDLGIFYARFSGTMSQPYTKSQLSEKLRRLRKKFRVISSRLAKGLHKSLLSPHDRSLFELSNQLWHPEHSSTSPFGTGSKSSPSSNLVGVKVSFSPTLPSPSDLPVIPVSNQTEMQGSHDIHVSNQIVMQELKDIHVSNQKVMHVMNAKDKNEDYYFGPYGDADGDVKLSEVNVEFEAGVGAGELPVENGGNVNEIGEIAAKTVVDVFDQCVKEARARAGVSFKEKDENFEMRWREQRVAELDVVVRRLRLVLEQSLQKQ